MNVKGDIGVRVPKPLVGERYLVGEHTQRGRAMQLALYEISAFNSSTCQYDIWMGTAPLETAKRYGLGADLSYPLYADESLCVDGWAFKSPQNRF